MSRTYRQALLLGLAVVGAIGLMAHVDRRWKCEDRAMELFLRIKIADISPKNAIEFTESRTYKDFLKWENDCE